MNIDDIKNTIINSDCLSIIKALPIDSIDLVITSPPYNKKEIYGDYEYHLGRTMQYDVHNDTMNESEYQFWQREILDELYKCSKQIFYNHKIRYIPHAIFPMEWILKTKWNIWQEIIWNKTLTANMRGWRFWHVDERWYWLTKNKPIELSSEYARWTSVWDFCPNRSDEHPCPFPEAMIKLIILALTKKDDLILDPFCGSGVVCKCAYELNRNFIGIDISKNYCEIANTNIKKVESYKQESLF